VRQQAILILDFVVLFRFAVVFAERIEIRCDIEGDEGGAPAQDLGVIPHAFIQRFILPSPSDVTGIIVFVGDGSVASYCRPEVGKDDALDRPEKDKTPLVDEVNGIGGCQDFAVGT